MTRAVDLDPKIFMSPYQLDRAAGVSCCRRRPPSFVAAPQIGWFHHVTELMANGKSSSLSCCITSSHEDLEPVKYPDASVIVLIQIRGVRGHLYKALFG
jgi:hypothetical protein